MGVRQFEARVRIQPMRKLYVLAAATMAGVSSVFSLLAELEKRYDLATRHLGWIASSAFLAAGRSAVVVSLRR